MKGGKAPLGYTIVEVMIVLAVSGVMFLIAATFISGKQARTTFSAGTNEMASQLQDVLEQVSDGKYSDIPLGCNVPPGAGSKVHFTGVGTGQGTNSDCVFVGKLVHFYNLNTTSPENYEVLPLAQPRLDPNGGAYITDLNNPYVKAIYQNGVGLVDLSVQSSTPHSLDIEKVTVVDDASGASTTFAYNVGFALSLGSAESGGKTFTSGAQTLNIIYVPGLGNNDKAINASGSVTDSKITGNIKIARSATICMSDGTRRALLLIGADQNGQPASQLGVNVQQLGVVASCP
jgi:prepilin-type N-terminal cleavage/methylation domain-containing protein